MKSNGGPEDITALNELAARIRYHTLLMVNKAKSAHIGTCYSMAELLAVLYGSFLRVDPERPDWPERDRFVLSKGHGAGSICSAV